MVGDEEAHAQQDESSQSSSKIDPTPKWKAAITLNVDKEDLVTLADTGCMHTATDVRQLEAAERHLPPNCTNFITYCQLYEFFSQCLMHGMTKALEKQS